MDAFAGHLCDDVPRAAYRRVDVGDARGLDEPLDEPARVGRRGVEEIIREGPEAEVERGGGSRGSLGAMGQVEIFEPGGCVRGGDGVCQRRVQVAGLLQRGEDGVAALLKLVQLGESIRHASKRALVHVPGRLFPVPRDEWHRALLVHQRDGLAHVPLSKAELARDGVEGPRAAPKGDARVPRGVAHVGSAMGRHACHTAVRVQL